MKAATIPNPANTLPAMVLVAAPVAVGAFAVDDAEVACTLDWSVDGTVIGPVGWMMLELGGKPVLTGTVDGDGRVNVVAGTETETDLVALTLLAE